MNWIEQKIIKLEKIINYIYCKVKNLTNIHNELDGLQGGQEGQYYHLTEEQYNNIDNIELTDEKIQITETTDFAQTGQTQKDFNKKVSDYKINADLKNQEQDDRMSDIESENIAQNDLINGLQADLDNQIAINTNQDERLENLEGINYTWSPTNRTLTLFDKNGTQLSQVSLVSLDNEGTDIRYNASTLSLELYNADNELLDSIPVSSFIGSVGTQLQLNSNQLQLKDSQGNILSTVNFSVSNINGLQTALDLKLDKPTLLSSGNVPKWSSTANNFVGGSIYNTDDGKIGISKTNPDEMLDVGGNVKAIDFKGQSIKFNLQASITLTPNTLVPKTDGSRPTWYNNSSVAKDVALFEDINSANITNAINSVNSSQLTTIRTKIFGSTTPASPVLNGISRSFIAQGEQNVLIDLFGLNLTLLDPTSVYIINPNDNSFLYAKAFANKTTTVVTTVWDIPLDFPIGNYPVKIQITSVPQGISTANVNIVSAYTLVDINQSSWKRKVRMKPDNSGEYTFLDTNTQYGLNYLQYQDTVSLVAGDVMKDIGGFDIAGGFAMITNSELLANKDWEVTINIKYLNNSGASTPYGYLVGVTSTNHSNFNLLTDLIKTASFLGRPNSFGGFETGVAEKAIPAGGTVTVVISKTGNTIFMRYIYFDGTNYTYQYKTVTGVDATLPYSVFISEPVGIWSSPTYFQIKQAFFNVKIMN